MTKAEIWTLLNIALFAIAVASCGKGKSVHSIPVEEVKDTYFLDEIADSRSYVLNNTIKIMKG